MKLQVESTERSSEHLVYYYYYIIGLWHRCQCINKSHTSES